MNIIPATTDQAILQPLLDWPFYAHLLTALPSPTDELVAQLAIAVGGNYQPLPLTVSMVADGLGSALIAEPITWIGLATNGTTIVGVAVCVQQGESQSSSDRFFAFQSFKDPEGAIATWTPDGRSLPLDLSQGFFRTRAGVA